MRYTPAGAIRDTAELCSLDTLRELYALDSRENELLWRMLARAGETMMAMRWDTHGTPHQVGTFGDLLAVKRELTQIVVERRYGTD